MYERDDIYEDHGYSRRRSHGYSCGGHRSWNGPCGASDCDSCHPGGYADDEEERTSDTTSTLYRIARKPRAVGTPYEIKPGDVIAVISGFSYEIGGPRLRYTGRSTRRIAKGPAWGEEQQEAPYFAVHAMNWQRKSRNAKDKVRKDKKMAAARLAARQAQ